jgi:hypothetical protein
MANLSLETFDKIDGRLVGTALLSIVGLEYVRDRANHLSEWWSGAALTRQ